MVEKHLIDKKTIQDFFVYMSNREIESTFPLIGEDPSALLKRAYEKVGVGCTALFIYKRMAIVELDEWTDLSLADVGQPKPFRNFLKASQEAIKKKKELYPKRNFTIVYCLCGLF